MTNVKQKMTVEQEEAELEAKIAEFRKTKAHRSLVEALNSGWLPQGTRIVDPKNPEAGRVIVFTPDEAELVAVELRKIVAARI